jgi:DNA-binding GntR family transcriptional regulator
LENAYNKDSEGLMNLEEADSLSEQIAKYISEQIISGELVEGERIQELRIAKELDVSRGSVREALLLLERTYLIEIFHVVGRLFLKCLLSKSKLCLIPM